MPLFRELFTHLPAALQFNIEVKYPMVVRTVIHFLYEKTELEMAGVDVTKNHYVDYILQELQATQSSRIIYFSSFDMDICWLLLHKQAMYPVFLLLGTDFSISID